MSELNQSIPARYGWLAFPLWVFVASRALLFAFAKAAPLFGSRMIAEASVDRGFFDAYPSLATLAHGEIANFARIARGGYGAVADVAYPPLLPLLGRGLGGLVGSLELGLLLLSLLACAAGFAGMYRLIEQFRDARTARWALALLAAFPLSYHLSDGSALSCGLAFSTWAVLLAARGSLPGAMFCLAAGVLAHPLGMVAGVVAAAFAFPSSLAPRGRGATTLRKLTLALVPISVLAVWLVGLGRHLGLRPKGIVFAVLPDSGPMSPAWRAVAIGFGPLLALGIVFAWRVRRMRVLAVAGGVQMALVLCGWSAVSTHAMAACWPLFLGWGDFLGRRQSLRAPAVAVLAAYQGLLFYCFTHFLRLT